MSTLSCNLYVNIFFQPFLTGQRRADTRAEVAAEAEKETDTETETEIGRRTGRDDIALVPGRDLARETVSGTEIEIEIETETETENVAKEETSLPVGVSAHLAPKKTKTETRIAGRTNMWTVLHQRSLQLVTSTMAKSPASCSLGALFSWRD